MKISKQCLLFIYCKRRSNEPIRWSSNKCFSLLIIIIIVYNKNMAKNKQKGGKEWNREFYRRKDRRRGKTWPNNSILAGKKGKKGKALKIDQCLRKWRRIQWMTRAVIGDGFRRRPFIGQLVDWNAISISGLLLFLWNADINNLYRLVFTRCCLLSPLIYL